MLKVSIIGAGNVGATTAAYISQSPEIGEIVLLDIREGFAEGKAMDIAQSLALLFPTKVRGVTNDYEATANSDIIIVTSGVPRKPGMTREELVGTNAKIVESVLREAQEYSPNAIYIMVSNPMDTMTYLALKVLDVPENHVLGMGGLLDSSRFTYYLSQALNKSTEYIHAYVIGGHGDTTMVPVISQATCGGIKVTELLSKEEQQKVIEQTMKGGATLTSMIGTSAWVAPAMCITRMVYEITNNFTRIIPCSVYRPEYGLCIGSRVSIGKNGKLEVIPEKEYCNEEELTFFMKSVEAVRNTNKAL